jgi:anti-anti-sigma factor
MYPTRPTISVQQDNDLTVVTLNDERILREEHIREIEGSVMQVVEEGGCPNLMLDFRHVISLSSAFLGLLVRIHKRMRERKGNLKLCNVNRGVYKAFKITKLNKVFDISRIRRR